MKSFLNIGCGPKGTSNIYPYFSGWQEIRVDIDPAVEPDIVSSIVDINQVDSHFVDAILCSHILEHLHYHNVAKALLECHRVLRPDGFMILNTPDLQAVAKEVATGNLDNPLYVSPAGPIAAIDIIYGHRASISVGRLPMEHKTGFTKQSLKAALLDAGFGRVDVVANNWELTAVAHREESKTDIPLTGTESKPEMDDIIAELQQDFEAIAMARPPYVLEKFVVGNHDHPAQQWAHCVLEMRIKYDALRRAKISREMLQAEIKQLESSGDEEDGLKADLKRIDIEEQDRAVLGAMREFEALYEIYQRFERRYSREELNGFQIEYWQARITRQANQDLLSTGRISEANLEALQNVGLAPPLQNERIGQAQQNYLSQGNRRILIMVPTEHKAESGLPVTEKLVIPGTMEYKLHNIYGLPVDKAYNEAVLMAMREGCDYLLTIEDDTFPAGDGLVKLLNHNLDIVGGWYPMRREPLEGVPIVVKNNQRQSLEPDGNIHEVYTIPQGFTLFKVDIFRRLQHPWFVTTPQLSQDSFFSQLAREAGFKLWCDTSILCQHIDRETGKVYEWQTPEI